MALSPGTRIGPHQIVGPIGAGEVYRARDTKLNRDVVLFEMLAGRRLFPGETLSDTLAAVLTREPDWTLLPSSTPPGVRRLLTRCLERDPRKRLRDVGDARLELEDARETTGLAESAPTRSLRALPWGLTVAAVLLAGWTLWGRTGLDTTAREVTHLDIGFPPDVEPIPSTAGGFALSPDGRTVLMLGARDGGRRALRESAPSKKFCEVVDVEAGFAEERSQSSFAHGSLKGNGRDLTLPDGRKLFLGLPGPAPRPMEATRRIRKSRRSRADHGIGARA